MEAGPSQQRKGLSTAEGGLSQGPGWAASEQCFRKGCLVVFSRGGKRRETLGTGILKPGCTQVQKHNDTSSVL